MEMTAVNTQINNQELYLAVNDRYYEILSADDDTALLTNIEENVFTVVAKPYFNEQTHTIDGSEFMDFQTKQDALEYRKQLQEIFDMQETVRKSEDLSICQRKKTTQKSQPKFKRL